MYGVTCHTVKYRMVKKRMKSHRILIGKTEAKILEYLAYNPNQLIEPLSKALKKDSKTIYTSTKNLLKKGYLTTRLTKSKKGVEYSGYRLNEKGLAYVMAYGKEELLFGALENYEKDLATFKDYQQLTSFLQPEIAIKILRLAGKAILQYGEKAWLPETPFMVAFSGLGRFTKSELMELKKVAKKVESIKLALQEKADEFYEYAYPNGEKPSKKKRVHNR